MDPFRTALLPALVGLLDDDRALLQRAGRVTAIAGALGLVAASLAFVLAHETSFYVVLLVAGLPGTAAAAMLAAGLSLARLRGGSHDYRRIERSVRALYVLFAVRSCATLLLVLPWAMWVFFVLADLGSEPAPEAEPPARTADTESREIEAARAPLDPTEWAPALSLEPSDVPGRRPNGPVAISTQLDRLVLRSHLGDVRIWDLATGEKIATLAVEAAIVTAAIAPDGSTVATGDAAGGTRSWRTDTGEQVAVLDGHRGRVASVAFSRDGSTIASGDEDGVAIVWDARTGQRRATLIGAGAEITAIALSPDGDRAATVSDELADVRILGRRAWRGGRRFRARGAGRGAAVVDAARRAGDPAPSRHARAVAALRSRLAAGRDRGDVRRVLARRRAGRSRATRRRCGRDRPRRRQRRRQPLAATSPRR